jgi:mRNA interferase YafQ
MLKTETTNKFEKDLWRAQRRGKDLRKLERVVNIITLRQSLPENLRNHKLIGNLQNHYECHLEPDWVLIYRIINDEILRLERTGTHADLF